MKKCFVLIVAILVAVLGDSAPTSAMPVMPEVGVPLCQSLPQTRAWFEEVTGYNTPAPPSFDEVLKFLDGYWDGLAMSTCTVGPCRPLFGGDFVVNTCGEVVFQKGDVFWGGWYNPTALPEGIEALSLGSSGWVGVYRVMHDGFRIPSNANSNCQGGRYLHEVGYSFLPFFAR